MDFKVFDFLIKEVPNSVEDIKVSLDLLVFSIDSAMDQVGQKVNKYFSERDFQKASELSLKSEELNSITTKIQEIIEYIDSISDEENVIDLNNENNRIELNYDDYLVDTNIEHNLYEDFTNKRPYALKIQQEKIQIRDWKSVLIETLNYLVEKDPQIINSFLDDPKMNGKKVKYFSNKEDEIMRSARKIDNADIYVETNLSANAIRNLLIKILNRYNIKMSEYKIYLRADYSDLR